ncbi:MAG: penicillin-binding transpeptidase domain-containing protein [Chloroflexi bacterium]|nr:penicillin-binding transpeptidase domain-containing protein [Chloroflexota bacterium]
MSIQRRLPIQQERERRISIFLVLTPVLITILLARLWWVQIVLGPQYQRRANFNHERVVTIQPLRGIVYDRYDQQLVENAPSWQITLIPADVPNGEMTAVLRRLSALTHIELESLDVRVRDDKGSPVQALTLVDGVQRDVAFSVLEHLDSLPGVHVDYIPQRQYIDGPAFAPVVGYVGLISSQQYKAALKTPDPYPVNSFVGKAGVEQVFEQQLRGILGHQTLEIDASGQTVQTISTSKAIPGDSVELTVAADVQRVAYQALNSLVQQGKATGGAVVAVDPRNGAVVVLASVPSYDPNVLSSGLTAAEWSRLMSNPAHPLVDHAISSQYPPGPMLDPFLAAAELQAGVLQPQRNWVCPQRIDVNGWLFFNSRTVPTAPVNTLGALGQGCSTLFLGLTGQQPAVTGVKQGLGHVNLLHWLEAFGFRQPTGIILPGETTGFLPTPSWYERSLNAAWTSVDTYLVASGAGPDAITPIQLAVATAALANGGKVWQPQLLQRLITPSGRVLTELSPHLTRNLALSTSTTSTIIQGLAEANRARNSVSVPGFTIAGLGGYATSPNTTGFLPVIDSWWTGFGPTYDPQIAVTVLVQDATDGRQAGNVAEKILTEFFHPSHAAEVSNVP